MTKRERRGEEVAGTEREEEEKKKEAYFFFILWRGRAVDGARRVTGTLACGARAPLSVRIKKKRHLPGFCPTFFSEGEATWHAKEAILWLE